MKTPRRGGDRPGRIERCSSRTYFGAALLLSSDFLVLLFLLCLCDFMWLCFAGADEDWSPAGGASSANAGIALMLIPTRRVEAASATMDFFTENLPKKEWGT